MTLSKARRLTPLSVTAGLGGSWYDDVIVVRYQPWAAISSRWYAEYKVFGGSYMTRAPDLKRLRLLVPFRFTLGRTPR